MKLCRVVLLLSLFAWASPSLAADERAGGLRVKIECEEPSGVLLDRETLQTARAALFSIHAFNRTSETRIVTLSWKITDAAGHVVLDNKEKYTITAGQFVTRRELFAAKSRGAFLLTAQAGSRSDGPDLRGEASFPFAVLASPPENDSNRAARRPLILVDTPLNLSASELTFHERIGARVLRSAVVDTAGDRADFKTLDAALRTRAAHGFATVGVLSAPPRTALRDDEEWLQFVLLLITRYPQVRAWEIVGNPAPDTLSEIARAARNMNPPRSVLGVAPQAFVASNRFAMLDGVLFFPPQDSDPRADEIHPAALRRAFLTDRNRTRDLGAPSFQVREDESAPVRQRSETPQESAAQMVTRTVLALAAGAGGTDAPLDLGTGQHTKFARGAALAFLSRTLGDASFHGEAFPQSPVVMAEVFAPAAGGSVAVMWAAPDQNGKEQNGKLSAWLEGTEVLDIFGNVITTTQRKNLDIPLGASPVYLQSSARPEEMLRVLREGTLKNIAPLAAQVLPLSQPVEKPTDKKADGKSTVAVKTAIRVRLQNIGVRAISGRLEINPPPSWKTDGTIYSFELAPGASRIFPFGVTLTKTNDQYPVAVKAIVDEKSGRGTWGWNQQATIATATNVAAGEAMAVDGRLDDWRGANWMEVAAERKNAVTGKLALKWDARYLYLAARVKEADVKPRHESAAEYSFWNGFDAIQLGFGVRDAAWAVPSGAPFRDTDFGLLLSPFHTRADGTIEGRVLRLWNAQQPFGTLPDRVRWGGVAAGGRLEIRRDEREGETIYEAVIPLTEMPELAPSTRVATIQSFDAPVRFSWILHTDEKNGGALQWAQQSNIFPWWNNTNSFLPPQNAALAAQTLLGFTARGEVSSGASTVLPPPPVIPPTSLPPASTPPSTVPLPLPPPPAPAPHEPSDNPPLPPASAPAPPENRDEDIGEPLPPYLPPSTSEPRPRRTPKPL
jgi:hypothetical protein